MRIMAMLFFCSAVAGLFEDGAVCEVYEAKRAAAHALQQQMFGHATAFTHDPTDYFNKRHSPYVTFSGATATVTVGPGDLVNPSIPYHPMIANVSSLHFTVLIFLVNQHGAVVAYQEFTPSISSAVLQVQVPESTTTLTPYAQCNLHGLFQGVEYNVAEVNGSGVCGVSSCLAANSTGAVQPCVTFETIKAERAIRHNRANLPAFFTAETVAANTTLTPSYASYIPDVVMKQGGVHVSCKGAISFVADSVANEYIDAVWVEDQAGNILKADLIAPKAASTAFEFRFSLDINMLAPNGSVTHITAFVSNNRKGVFQSAAVDVANNLGQLYCNLQGCEGVTQTAENEANFSPEYCPLRILRAEGVKHQVQLFGQETAFTLSATNAKHVPYFSLDGATASVGVGEVVNHPMTPGSLLHYITMIYVENQNGEVIAGATYAATSGTPVLTFVIPLGTTEMTAYAACNLHGVHKMTLSSIPLTGPSAAIPCGLTQCLQNSDAFFPSEAAKCPSYDAVETRAVYLQKRVFAEENPFQWNPESAYNTKHTPFITVSGEVAVIDVGFKVVDGVDIRPVHPIGINSNGSLQHLIVLIYVKNQNGQVVSASEMTIPGAQNSITFVVPSDATALTAFAYCNLHGLFEGPTVTIPSREPCLLASCFEATTILPTAPEPETAESCLPSGLTISEGLSYKCMQEITTGLTLHWSLDSESASERGISIAIVSATQGWLGVSFPERFGSMVPAEAVIAVGDGVGAYAVTAQEVAGVVKNAEIARRFALMEGSHEFLNGERILRFRRSAEGLTSGDVAMNAARHPTSDALEFHGDTAVSFKINFVNGAVEAEMVEDLKSYRLLHASLMIVAWCFILPFGIIIKRYGKPIFGLGNSIRRGTIGWAFKAHVVSMVVSTVMITAAFVIAATKFTKNAEPDKLKHNKLGYYVFGLLAVMPLMGLVAPILFPTANTPGRNMFAKIHPACGRIAYLMAMFQIFSGIKKLRTTFMLADEAETLHTIAVIGVTATVMSVIILEFLKQKFVIRKKKRYAKTMLTDKVPWDEVKLHTGTADPWVVVENKIFAINTWAAEHPGGPDVLFAQAGGDATEAFLSFSHSRLARSRMEKYFIGEVEDDRMVSAVELAEEIANSLVRLSLNEADRLIQECENAVPHTLLTAYKSLLLNLDAYLPYLPSSLVEMNESQTEAAGEVYAAKRAQDRVSRDLEMSPPTTAAIAFTDIQSSTSLWEASPAAMKTALERHNDLIREVITKTNGYEVKTIGDAFMVAFTSGKDALDFGLGVQMALVGFDKWPAPLLEVAHCAEVHDSASQKIWGGPRVRIGIHMGLVEPQKNPITGRIDFFGNTVNKAARVEGASVGGAVAVTEELLAAINEDDMRKLGDLDHTPIGKVPLKGVTQLSQLTLLLPEELHGRKKDLLATITEKKEGRPQKRDPAVSQSTRESGRPVLGGSIRSVTDMQKSKPFHCSSATCASVRINFTYLQSVQVAPHAISSVISPLLDTVQRTDGLMQTVCGGLILATWGVNRRCAQHSIQAVRFSVILRDLGWNAHTPYEVWGKHMFVGLATGNCVHGGVGNSTQKVMIVLGGTVTLSQRLASIGEQAGAFALGSAMPGARGFAEEQSLRMNIRAIDVLRSTTSGDDLIVHEINTASLSTCIMSWGFSCEGAADDTWAPEFSALAIAALTGNAESSEHLEKTIKDLMQQRACTDCPCVARVVCSDCKITCCTSCAAKTCVGHEVEEADSGSVDGLTYLLQRSSEVNLEKRGIARHHLELSLREHPGDTWLGQTNNGDQFTNSMKSGPAVRSPNSVISPYPRNAPHLHPGF